MAGPLESDEESGAKKFATSGWFSVFKFVIQLDFFQKFAMLFPFKTVVLEGDVLIAQAAESTAAHQFCKIYNKKGRGFAFFYDNFFFILQRRLKQDTRPVFC